MKPFADRQDAGRQLAALLARFRERNAVVLGLPRGGVPVAREVAAALGAPLDVIVVRKLGMPFQPELAMGAIAEGGIRFLDRRLVQRFGVTPDELASVEERERLLLEARQAMFRAARSPADLNGRLAIVVDDGLATGATARVACLAARSRGAASVVLAVPVAPPEAGEGDEEFAEADEVVCVQRPRAFAAVGAHYLRFGQTSDTEVDAALTENRSRHPY
jgi:putative phosphoribosyl transferase